MPTNGTHNVQGYPPSFSLRCFIKAGGSNTMYHTRSSSFTHSPCEEGTACQRIGNIMFNVTLLLFLSSVYQGRRVQHYVSHKIKFIYSFESLSYLHWFHLRRTLLPELHFAVLTSNRILSVCLVSKQVPCLKYAHHVHLACFYPCLAVTNTTNDHTPRSCCRAETMLPETLFFVGAAN